MPLPLQTRYRRLRDRLFTARVVESEVGLSTLLWSDLEVTAPTELVGHLDLVLERPADC